MAANPRRSRDAERYQELMALTKTRLLGQFTTEEKKAIIDACCSVDFAEFLTIGTVYDHVERLLNEHGNNYSVHASVLLQKINELNGAEMVALVDAVERFEFAAKAKHDVHAETVFGEEWAYTRSRLFAALHEAGHAFFVVFMDVMPLAEVKIRPDPERGWYRTDGFYQGEIQDNYLEMVSSKEHMTLTIGTLIAGRVAQAFFPDMLPLRYSDAWGATRDNAHVGVIAAQYLMQEGTRDRATIIAKTVSLIEAAEQMAFHVFSTFPDALRELWLTLADKTVLSGDEVKGILSKHRVI